MNQPTIALGSVRLLLWRRPVRLPLSQLCCHTHVLGKTGAGKSYFLAALFLSLHRAGSAVTLIDPHGDLATLILRHLIAGGDLDTPEGRRRLTYLNLRLAEARGRYLPFNLLAQPYPDHAMAELIAEGLPAGLAGAGDRRPDLREHPQTLGDRAAAGRAAGDRPGPAPDRPGVPAAGAAPGYRRAGAAVLPPSAGGVGQGGPAHEGVDAEPDGPADPVAAAAGRTRRPGQRPELPAPAGLRHLLSYQPGHSLPGHPPAAGLPAHRRMEAAALSRADRPLADRQLRHHLIIDEFSQFLAQSEESLTRMLSETRKYGLFVVMAHQNWSQASDRLKGALQNVGLEVILKAGRFDAEYSARLLGSVDPLSVKHTVSDEAALERTHPSYYSLPEQWESYVQAIQTLRTGQAFLRLPDDRVVKVDTPRLPPVQVDPDRLAAVEDEYLHRSFRVQPAPSQAAGVPVFAGHSPIPRRGTR